MWRKRSPWARATASQSATCAHVTRACGRRRRAAPPSDCSAPSILSIDEVRLGRGVACRRSRGRRAWRSCPRRACASPRRIAREKPASGSHGVPLRQRARPPARRSTAYGGGNDSRWWLRSPEAVRNGGLRYSSPQSPGIGVRVASAASSSSRSSLGQTRTRTDAQVVVDVLALAEPGADDDAGHGRLLEHPAAGDVGDRHAVPARHRVRGREHALQSRPIRRRRG